MSWKINRQKERLRYRRYLRRQRRRRLRNLSTCRRLCHALSFDREIVRFRIKKHERPFVSQEGARGFQLPTLLKAVQKNSLVITLPEVFSFDDNYLESATVIGIIRRAIEEGRHIGYIDFSRMKHISPACLTVFSCYADLWKQLQPSLKILPMTWQPGIFEMFKQIGFIETLGFNSDDKGNVPLNVGLPAAGIKYLGLRKYLIPAPGEDIGALVRGIRKDIECFAGCKFNTQAMFASVTEAITNIKDHAYANEKRGRLPRKWWLSVSLDTASSLLHIIIFDRGLGIPRTMQESSKFSAYRRLAYSVLANNWAEKDRLFLAFERTRNEVAGRRAIAIKGGHGNGCGDLLQMAESASLVEGNNEQGILSVISNNARYVYKASYGVDPGVSRALKCSLQGTLLEWRIKI